MSWKQFWTAMNWSGTPIWTPSATVGFNMDHVEGGLLFGCIAQLLGGNPESGVTACLAWTCLKEWGFDMLYERDSVLGSLADTVGYLVGVGLWTAGRNLWG
jgi:hypothetical protein